MEEERTRPLVTLGDPAELLPRRVRSITAPELPRSEQARGLVLKRFTLHQGYDGWWARWRKRPNQVFFVTTALDLSGMQPVTYPADPASAERVWFTVHPGRPIDFTLGVGLPIFPARPLVGGLVATILVSETDGSARRIGEVMGNVATALENDTGVVDFLAALANPAQLGVAVVAGGVGKIVGVVSAVLAKNGNDHVGLFQGYFPAREPWTGLEQDQEGAKVELSETVS